MSIIRVITYQIYLLQQENYEIPRYFRSLLNKTLHFGELTFRQPIVWTNKLKLVSAIAFLYFCLTLKLIWNVTNNPVITIISLPFVWLFYGIFLGLAVFLISPLDKYQKKQIISSGQFKLSEWKSQDPSRIIIGIAGSYGKSSVKNVLEILLSQKYNVLATTGNENTPIGISRLLSRELKDQTQIVILELGEYVIGDIKEMCDLFKPDFGVITGINEAHLERMGGIQNTIKAIFELAQGLPEGAKLYYNEDDQKVSQNQVNYNDNLISIPYSNNNVVAFFDTSKLAYIGQNIELNMLAPYGLGLVVLAQKIGIEFGLTKLQIETAIKLIKPVPHRLEAIKGQNGTLVIDDSYNGNPDGVRAAIQTLQLFNNKTIVYCTPGLVEVGYGSEAIHFELGKELAAVVDILVLVENKNTEAMAKGYLSVKNDGKIQKYQSGPQLHTKFGELLKGGEVILFQNDLTDNY